MRSLFAFIKPQNNTFPSLPVSSPSKSEWPSMLKSAQDLRMDSTGKAVWIIWGNNGKGAYGKFLREILWMVLGNGHQSLGMIQQSSSHLRSDQHGSLDQ